MTKQKNATFSIPIKGINQLIEVKQQKLFPLKQYVTKNLYLFNKKSKRQTHKPKHQIFGRDIFKTTSSSGNLKVFEENLYIKHKKEPKRKNSDFWTYSYIYLVQDLQGIIHFLA